MYFDSQNLLKTEEKMRTSRQYEERGNKHFFVHKLEVIKHLCLFVVQVGWCQHNKQYHCTFNF